MLLKFTYSFHITCYGFFKFLYRTYRIQNLFLQDYYSLQFYATMFYRNQFFHNLTCFHVEMSFSCVHLEIKESFSRSISFYVFQDDNFLWLLAEHIFFTFSYVITLRLRSKAKVPIKKPTFTFHLHYYFDSIWRSKVRFHVVCSDVTWYFSIFSGCLCSCNLWMDLMLSTLAYVC